MSIAALDTHPRSSETPTVGRITGAIYGIITYATFAATLVYAICFICGIVVPKTINAPATTLGTGAALAINVLLLDLPDQPLRPLRSAPDVVPLPRQALPGQFGAGRFVIDLRE